MLAKISKRLSGMQLIALGFLVIIVIGTFLLMLPFSSRSGSFTPFLTCLFTATSATCVTGLILVDTFTHWSFFGQLVLLILIQIGGLGFITFGVSIAIIMHKKIGLKERGLIRESVSAMDLGGVVKLTKHIVKGTAIFEGIGALILTIRFIPELGFFRALYYGIFHSISAFCNAGFDLMGRYSPFSSMTRYYDDWIVNITLIALILIGGLGFIVWNDLYINRLNYKKYSFHTKIVLTCTFVLTVGGALFFYLIEKDNLFNGMSFSGKFLSSLFCSVTPRTAGFNTTDTSALSDAGKMLSIILMFIGGCPGSTAGGVKVTSVFVLLLHLYATLTRSYGCNIFGRRLEDSAVPRAAAVCSTNMLLALSASLAICAIEHSDGIDTMFEIFSAVSTVGMSAGLTGQLHTTSKLIVIFLMYLGRLGSLSFALSFATKKKIAHVKLPTDRLNIG